MPEENIESAKKEIFDVIKRVRKKTKAVDIKCEIMSSESPVVSKAHNVFFDDFSESVKQVNKRSPKYALLAGGTDIRFLMRKGIPAVGYSVDGGNSCHCDNESVKITSLIDTAKIFALFFTRSRGRK